MIVGIGTDIIEIDRIEQAIAKLGDRFITKNFSTAEIKAAERFKNPIAYYAKRFAAKEAFAKALGTGIGGAAAFKDISTLNDKQGAPYIELTGDAAMYIKNLQKNTGSRTIKIHISLSDEKQYAQAFVILELL